MFQQFPPPFLAFRSTPTTGWTARFILFLLLLSSIGNNPAHAGKSVRTGDEFPVVTWTTMDGEAVRFEEIADGRAVVMVFWATWCSVCKKDWPDLTALSNEFDGTEQAPQWVAVSVRDKAAEAKKIAAERNLPGLQLNDPEEIAFKELGLQFIPHVIVINAEGKVAYSDRPRIGKLRKLLSTLAETSSPVKESR